jgi:hypothetical protein
MDRIFPTLSFSVFGKARSGPKEDGLLCRKVLILNGLRKVVQWTHCLFSWQEACTGPTWGISVWALLALFIARADFGPRDS